MYININDFDKGERDQKFHLTSDLMFMRLVPNKWKKNSY